MTPQEVRELGRRLTRIYLRAAVGVFAVFLLSLIYAWATDNTLPVGVVSFTAVVAGLIGHG